MTKWKSIKGCTNDDCEAKIGEDYGCDDCPPTSTYKFWKHDIALEALAHYFGYQTFDQASPRATGSGDSFPSHQSNGRKLLQCLGYKVPQETDVAEYIPGNSEKGPIETSNRVRFFDGDESLVLQELRGNRQVVTAPASDGLFVIHFVPLQESDSDIPHVIAFRGTQGELSDIYTDLELSVGDAQFSDNQNAIRAIIDEAHGMASLQERELVLTGHSLGGALAQQAALDTVKRGKSIISRVVTFQAPGLYSSKIVDWNDAVPKKPRCTHHVSKYDVVDMAGDDHLYGDPDDGPPIFLHTCQGEQAWYYKDNILQAHRVGMLLASPCGHFHNWRSEITDPVLGIEQNLENILQEIRKTSNSLVIDKWEGGLGMEVQSFDRYDDYRKSRLPNISGFVLESLDGTSKWLTMCPDDKDEKKKAQKAKTPELNGG